MPRKGKGVRSAKARGPRIRNRTSKKLSIPRMPTAVPKAITFKLQRKQTWNIHSTGITDTATPPTTGKPHPNTKCLFRFRANYPGTSEFHHESPVHYRAAVQENVSMVNNRYYAIEQNSDMHFPGLETWCGDISWNIVAGVPKWTEDLPPLFKHAVVIKSSLSGRYTAQDNNRKTDDVFMEAPGSSTENPFYSEGFQSPRNYVATGTFRVDAESSDKELGTHVFTVPPEATIYDFKGRLQGFSLKEARNVQGTDNTNVQIACRYDAKRETLVAKMASAEEQTFEPSNKQIIDLVNSQPEPGERTPDANYAFVICIGPSDANRVCHDFRLEIIETMIVKVWSRNPLGLPHGPSKLISAATPRSAYGMAAMSEAVAGNARRQLNL